MPPPNNGRTARVALRAARDTRDFINTFHFARTDNAVLGAADLANIGTVVADWWLNSYRTAFPNVVVGQDITTTKQDPSDPLQNITYIAAPGSRAGTILPGDVTAAVSWRTGLAGRKFRGRFYDFGMSQGDNNSNDSMTGGYIAILTAIGQYLINHAATAAIKLIIFHRSDNTYTDVTSLVVDQLIDSMRRRLAGRGV